MEYGLLALGWIVYFAVHSILASDKVKAIIPLGQQTYRLIYSLISGIGLLLLLFFNGTFAGEALIERNRLVQYISLIMAAVGVIIANAAFRNYSVAEFLGLKHESQPRLVTTGINAWVRHPLYTATILITAGFFLYDSRVATAVSVGCIWLYLVIGIYLEEKKLVKVFGDRYREYQQNVAAVIPFLL
jgi:protein-S-isoprenylcysteine O-methyltransferase Ste14